MSISEAFARFPTLTTDRLRLREIRLSDRDYLYDLWSDPDATQFLQHLAHHSIEDTDLHLDMIALRYDRYEAITWAITFKERETELLGTASFHHFGANFRRVETGYALRPTYWRQGIAYEAMTAVLNYGFNTLSLHRIEALIDDDNSASKNLLLKLGFTYEGNLRQRFLIGGELHDEHYYGLLHHEWPPNGSQ